MKFTFNWLQEHLDTKAPFEEIVLALTAVGLEVEDVHDPRALYAPFKTAKIIAAEKHPNADRLKVCTVDTGNGTVQVVCGAPNARAGMMGVFAPDGSYIPGLDVTLKKSKIRDVESNGMMVSEREMKLSDEHNGIIELPENTPIGLPMAELFHLDDPVVEINVTPNRADCAGIRGIARDLAAAGYGTLKPIDSKALAGGFETTTKVHLKFNDPENKPCPLFVGRLIKGVRNGPSPAWLQARLKAIGLRPISVLVDITNYMTIGLNRPLHVFDADKLKGDIHVRLANKGETLDALNDKTYTLDETMTVVCDDSGVLGLGGIMGGTATGCTDDTVNVYVESAYFDPVRTAMTGRALQINSDARYRFERGIDPQFTVQGMDVATAMILDLCGGTPGTVVIAGTAPDITKKLPFDPAYTKQLGGIAVETTRQKDILAALGFTFVNDNTVQSPSWRPDIDGKADLVEEVLRINGYDNIMPVSMRREGSVTKGALDVSLKRRSLARRALAASGLKEAVTWSFLHHDIGNAFEPKTLPRDALTIANPISAELDRMRPSIIPNLVAAAQRNADKGFPDTALFEVGPVFYGTGPDEQPFVAAGIRQGHMGQRHWTGPAAARAVDALDAKSDAMALLDACGAPASRMQVTRDAPGYYHPGRSGSLKLGNQVIAWFGELHPNVISQLKADGPVAAFEVFLDRLPPRKGGAARPLLKNSPFQPVTRDFAFIVDTNVEAGALIRAAMDADKALVTAVNVFDVYAGKGMEPGKKSVAISVTLQPTEKTLSDQDIETVARNVVKIAGEKTGAVLRG